MYVHSENFLNYKLQIREKLDQSFRTLVLRKTVSHLSQTKILHDIGTEAKKKILRTGIVI